MSAPRGGAVEHTPVAVVGTGPVGMTAALALGLAGVPVTVLETGPDLAAESRASTFHPSTLEILDGLGVVEELHTVGLKAPTYQYWERRGGLVAEFDLALLAEETPFPYRLQSEQNNLTRIIRDRLSRMPNVDLRFSSQVERVECGSGRVGVFLDGAGLEPTLTADWLIGADGAASAVRRSLGIAFEGVTYPERFLVASTEHDFGADFDDLAHVSYISDPVDWGVLLRTPRHWRVLFPIHEGESDAQAQDPGNVERRLQSLAPQPRPYPVAHTTLYRVHQRVASAFAVGRVLLAGDAAHVNNPLGGMGMNSGIHDAQAAVEAVLAARAGADPARCAAAYAGARRDAAVRYVQKATQRNYEDLQERDGAVARRRAEHLAAVAADPDRARRYLRETTLLSSLGVARGRLRRALRSAGRGAEAPAGQRLSEALRGEPVTAPGCFDALSAKLLSRAGFAAAYVSGAGVSATALGRSDRGYVGAAEMAGQIRTITAATGVPVIADGDTGYGGELQVAATVETYERAGAAAIQMEDQLAPKRCGSLPGKQLIPAEEMVLKIGAALGARRDLLVIARTDALAVEGLDDALRRAAAYAEAGADLVFVEGAHDEKVIREVHRAVPDTPLVVSRSEAAGHPPLPDAAVLADCGVAVVIHPVSALLAAAAAVREAYAALASGSGIDGVARLEWADLTDVLDEEDVPTT